MVVKSQEDAPSATKKSAVEKIKNSARVVHVLVALCDNENQGIVPVPTHLGNGEDPEKNLYWGAAYGVKTYFSKSPNWTKVAEFGRPKDGVLERIVFKHKKSDIYLIADGYRGSRMKQTIADFFEASSGSEFENVVLNGITLQVMGASDIVAFVGHNGLMDDEFTGTILKADDGKREAIILACASRNYFSKHLKKAGAEPLLWTTNLMAPEAYILHDALEGWAAGEKPEQIRTRAAAAYAKYQRISQKAAEGLLVTGW
ncbi:MAG: hypothetical protein HOP17_08735 [Acidobacteria bacterium]|nr:hypothetical protein [Acidobacteriota bacterium]